MSKTFTSRPAVTQSRGRGRGTATRTQTNTRTTQATPTAAAARPRMYGNPSGALGRGAVRGMMTGYNAPGAMNLEEELERSPAQVPQEQRMSYEGSYTKITPNEKKRQQIQQVAQQEELAYNTHKQQNTPSNLNYVGTVGGGGVREADVRRRSQQEFSKVHRLERKQQLTANKKSAEQAEIDKRKAEQRRKAEMNEERKQEEERNSAHKWDEQRRRTNEAFLRRLENKSKKPPPSMAQNYTEQTSPSPPRSYDMSDSSHFGASSRMASLEINNNPEASDFRVGGARTRSSGAGGGITDEMQKKVIALKAIFPQYEETELRGILTQLNGSLDEAVAVLQD